MDKATRQCINWLKRESIKQKLIGVYALDIEFTETDTMISNNSTVSKDINLAEFMHKIGGVYRE